MGVRYPAPANAIRGFAHRGRPSGPVRSARRGGILGRMGRLERSLSLFTSSWSVVRDDRELLVLPVVSAIVNLVVMASFAVPAWLSLQEVATYDSAGSASSGLEPTVLTYVVAIAFYFCTAFVVIFFNAALIHGANERFEGGDPTLSSALAGAWQRVGTIAQWAAVSATVSMVIRQIQERGGLLGKLIGSLLGFVWGVVTFLVLPSLVIEGVGVGEAFQRSKNAIRSTWGENLAGQVGLGLVGFVAALPIIGLGVAGVFLLGTSVPLGVALLVVAVAALLILSILTSAMGVVYQTALFRYATQRPIAGYDGVALAGAFTPKRAGRFGR